MAQQSITYAVKTQFRVSPVPDDQKWRFGDANEVRTVINANAADAESRLATNENNIGNNESNITTNAINIGQNATNLDSHTNDLANPHVVTKAQVGLGNADNTSDLNKPISDAAQLALDLKADQAALVAHEVDQANPHAVNADQVGLGNVDNTADVSKPISAQQQAALDLKKDILASANVRASVDIASSITGDFWLFRLPSTTQSREYVVVIQYHRPDDAGRFGKSVTLSVGLGNTSGLPDRGGSIIQTGGFGVDSALSAVFIRFVGGQYYLGFTSVLNGGTSRLAISVHGPDAQNVDFSVLNTAASGADIISLAPTVLNEARNLLTTEQDLGNPAEEGLLLSSTVAGVRSWADLSNFGITREFFQVTTVVDDWYRIARLDAGSIWGESWDVGLAFRSGNASQGMVFGGGTTYNNARLGVHTNAFSTLLCKSLRVTWAAPNWVLEFQAGSALVLDVWGQIRTARIGVVWLDGAAGSGQVYGSTITDAQIPLANTFSQASRFGNMLATPGGAGYTAPPVNNSGGEQDPPELSEVEAQALNIEVAGAVLERMVNDALQIAYDAEADLTKITGTAYVEGLISAPPISIVLQSDYLANSVDQKYL